MRSFCAIPSGRMKMTRETRERLPKGMTKMGALIWFLFVGIVLAVLERETFFS